MGCIPTWGRAVPASAWSLRFPLRIPHALGNAAAKEGHKQLLLCRPWHRGSFHGIYVSRPGIALHLRLFSPWMCLSWGGRCLASSLPSPKPGTSTNPNRCWCWGLLPGTEPPLVPVPGIFLCNLDFLLVLCSSDTEAQCEVMQEIVDQVLEVTAQSQGCRSGKAAAGMWAWG